MASIEEKQIAKEILFKAMDSHLLTHYGQGAIANNEKNVGLILEAYSKILNTVVEENQPSAKDT